MPSIDTTACAGRRGPRRQRVRSRWRKAAELQRAQRRHRHAGDRALHLRRLQFLPAGRPLAVAPEGRRAGRRTRLPRRLLGSPGLARPLRLAAEFTRRQSEQQAVQRRARQLHAAGGGAGPRPPRLAGHRAADRRCRPRRWWMWRSAATAAASTPPCSMRPGAPCAAGRPSGRSPRTATAARCTAGENAGETLAARPRGARLHRVPPWTGSAHPPELQRRRLPRRRGASARAQPGGDRRRRPAGRCRRYGCPAEAAGCGQTRSKYSQHQLGGLADLEALALGLLGPILPVRDQPPLQREVALARRERELVVDLVEVAQLHVRVAHDARAGGRRRRARRGARPGRAADRDPSRTRACSVACARLTPLPTSSASSSASARVLPNEAAAKPSTCTPQVALVVEPEGLDLLLRPRRRRVVGPRHQSVARSAWRRPSPISGLRANGSVGLRPSMMSSSRVCTLASAFGWL